MPPNQSGQYDFIMNPQQTTTRRGGPRNKKTLIFLGIAAFIVIIILAYGANFLLSSGSRAQADRLTEVAKAETELIRVSALGADNAKDRDTMVLAQTTKLSVSSSQLQTKKLLEKRGVNAKEFTKLMASSKNSKTDTQLTEAGRNNRYDETFKTILNKQLADYQKLIKGANDGGTSAEKKVLTNSFENAGKLLPKKTATGSSNDTDTTETEE